MIYWLWSPPTNVLLLFAKCLILKPDLQLSQSNLILILLTHALYTLTPKEDWIENGQHCNWKPNISCVSENFYNKFFICCVLLSALFYFLSYIVLTTTFPQYTVFYYVVWCCFILISSSCRNNQQFLRKTNPIDAIVKSSLTFSLFSIVFVSFSLTMTKV